MSKFKLSNKIIPYHIQMGPTSNDKRSLVRSDKRQKGKHRERESHVKTAETGVMYLQVKEQQGFPGAGKRQERTTSIPKASGRSTALLTL